MCQELALESPDGVIPDIASAFGGGIGNSGNVCGSVIGAVMAIGLARGRGESVEDYLGTAAMVQDLTSRFEELTGSLRCRDLTGMEMRTPEQIEQFMTSDVPATVCIPAVTQAYRLAMDALGRPT